MSFTDVLKDVAESVKGARSAFIVGMDGILVDEFNIGSSGVDVSSIGAEYGNVLKEVQNASESLKLGNAAEVSVLTDSMDLIIRKINEEYFVALLMAPDGNFGKGRFKVRCAARKLITEF